MKETKRILFFDGVCGLCNSLVDFALPKVSEGELSFAPLQGLHAQKLLLTQDLSLDYVVYLRDDKIHRKTKAVAYLLQDIGGFYKLASIMLHVLPTSISDFFYDIVAKYRYRIFGRSEACRLPTPSERIFFLD